MKPHGLIRSASRATNSSSNATSSVRNAQAGRIIRGSTGAPMPNPSPLARGPMHGTTSHLVAGFTGPSNSTIAPTLPHSRRAAPSGLGSNTAAETTINKSSALTKQGRGSRNNGTVSEPARKTSTASTQPSSGSKSGDPGDGQTGAEGSYLKGILRKERRPASFEQKAKLRFSEHVDVHPIEQRDSNTAGWAGPSSSDSKQKAEELEYTAHGDTALNTRINKTNLSVQGRLVRLHLQLEARSLKDSTPSSGAAPTTPSFNIPRPQLLTIPESSRTQPCSNEREQTGTAPKATPTQPRPTPRAQPQTTPKSSPTQPRSIEHGQSHTAAKPSRAQPHPVSRTQPQSATGSSPLPLLPLPRAQLKHGLPKPATHSANPGTAATPAPSIAQRMSLFKR